MSRLRLLGAGIPSRLTTSLLSQRRRFRIDLGRFRLPRSDSLSITSLHMDAISRLSASAFDSDVDSLISGIPIALLKIKVYPEYFLFESSPLFINVYCKFTISIPGCRPPL